MSTENTPGTPAASPHQAMEEACAAGDVAALQQLLHDHNIHPGNPALSKLLYCATAARQLPVVAFLLDWDSSPELIHYGLGGALINHPDPAIARRICARDPGVPNVDPGNRRTYLSMACDKPPADIAGVLRVFLEVGADVDLYARLDSPVACAVRSQQPLDILQDMVRRLSRMDPFAMLAVVGSGRPDIVRLFLGHPVIPDVSIVWIDKSARETGNQEVVDLVTAFLAERQQQQQQQQQQQHQASTRLSLVFARALGRVSRLLQLLSWHRTDETTKGSTKQQVSSAKDDAASSCSDVESTGKEKDQPPGRVLSTAPA